MDLQAMIVAIYARVSTSDQSCDMQLHALREYVAKQGWQVFQEYVDTGFSGVAASRPRLDQLLRDARLQKFEGCRCGGWATDAIIYALPE
jgi:site-specific DNA recombinase